MDLATHGLSFAYPKGPRVLRDVTLSFEDPVTVIIGPNGAGKSTLLRLLGHLTGMRPQAGGVTLGGVDIGERTALERVKHIAYLSQTPRVSSPLTVEEVVALSRTLTGPSEACVARAIEEVGLMDRRKDRFSQLSVGQRQLAAFARALSQFGFESQDGARYLLADEPIAALDPHHAVTIARQLRAATERNIRCVLVAHNLAFAEAVAGRVIGLGGDGTVVADGAPERILTEGVLERLYGCRFVRGDRASGGGLKPRYLPD